MENIPLHSHCVCILSDIEMHIYSSNSHDNAICAISWYIALWKNL